jgi:hypothetical protein
LIFSEQNSPFCKRNSVHLGPEKPMKKLHGLRFSAWSNGLSLSGTLLIAVVLSLAGCSKNQTPSNDPFSPHPIIPPPGTGGYSTATPDPGYPANAAARTNPSLIPSVSGVPAASGASNTASPTNVGAPANSNPGYANPNSMPPGYGPGSTSSNIIPPPNTLSNGGYPNAAANSGAMPNNYGASVSGASATSDPRAGSSSTLNALINSTPRPTTTRSGSPYPTPAASIPGSIASNAAGARPFDGSQPIRAPSAYDAEASSNPPTIANNSAVGTPRVPQQGVPSNSIARPSATMPMPPTAYGNPNAVPAYLSSIQSIEEANWIPCDGYADDDEE